MASAAARYPWTRYGDVLVNMARVHQVTLRQAGMMGRPALLFWTPQVVSFAGTGPDTRPLEVYFDTNDAARSAFEQLSADVEAVPDDALTGTPRPRH